jgi:hypothetical protein
MRKVTSNDALIMDLIFQAFREDRSQTWVMFEGRRRGVTSVKGFILTQTLISRLSVDRGVRWDRRAQIKQELLSGR